MVAVAAIDRHDGTTVDYWPRGASADLFRNRDIEAVVAGPAGTGKTLGCLWRLHLAALKHRGMRGLMLRKTHEDLTASALVTYQERVLAAGVWGVVPFGGSKLQPAGFRYPNGSRLLIGGLDKADKVMSRDYDLIFTNEAWELAEDDWQKLITRINRPGRAMPYNQLFGDTNPQHPGHWIARRAQAGKLALLESFHRDNPRLWDGQDWTDEGRSYLATLESLSGYLRQRLLLGQWAAAEGAVYPAFDRRVHVQSVDCAGWGTILALDVGTRNPTALGTIRHAGDRIHVEAEFYEAGLGSDEITDEVERRYRATKAAYVAVDPSAAAVIVSLQKRGVTCRKANNDVAEGIRRVTSVLPDLTIDPSCVHTIEEHEGYHYPSNATKDAPVKADDHTCFVGGTAILTPGGYRSICDLRPGDMVETPIGPRRVMAAGMTAAAADVFRLRLSNGATITGTGNHPVFVADRGWIRLDSLRYGDTMEAAPQRPGGQPCASKPWSTEGSSSGVTPTLPTTPIATTTGPAWRTPPPAWGRCTARFGRTISGLSRTVARSITTTGTRQTTTRATSFASRLRSIGPFMRTKAANGVGGPSASLILNPFARLPQPGTAPTRGALGTGSTPAPCGLVARLPLVLATTAAASTPRGRHRGTSDFAPTPASPPPGGQAARTTCPESARTASDRSSSIGPPSPAPAPVCVLGVFAAPRRQPVYNLTVEEAGAYYAGGILVHNCDMVRYAVMSLTSAPPVVAPLGGTRQSTWSGGGQAMVLGGSR